MTKIQELIAECTAYDYKVALEESKPKSWLKSVSALPMAWVVVCSMV